MKPNPVFRMARVAASYALLLGVFALIGQVSFASVVLPGFDLFRTPPGGATFNPADYGIGPAVNIPMVGRPIGPGNTDTIVQRFGSLPPSGTGTIPLQITALSLESIAPIPLGSSFFDVFVDLDPSATSPGGISVTTHNDLIGGGTFSSSFLVGARMTFTEVGNPSNVQQFPVNFTMSSTGSSWSHFAPLAYPNVPAYPSGGFYPGTVSAGPSLPSQSVGVTRSGPISLQYLATPEPSSVIVFGITLAIPVSAARRYLR